MTSRVSVRVAKSPEYERLADLYLAWGYKAGIAASDVVFVADLGARVVGLGTTNVRARDHDVARNAC
jgi:hypothetical protein